MVAHRQLATARLLSLPVALEHTIGKNSAPVFIIHIVYNKLRSRDYGRCTPQAQRLLAASAVVTCEPTANRTQVTMYRSQRKHRNTEAHASRLDVTRRDEPQPKGGQRPAPAAPP
eukprot:4594969-Prymnesium_polylepis.1